MSSTETIELTNRPARQQITIDPEQDSTIESLTPITTINVLYGEDDPNDYPDGGLKAYSVLLGSFLGLVVNFGILNSIGAIQAYVSTHQLSNLKETSISWIFSIYLSLAYAGGLFVGPVFDRKGPLVILLVSTAFIFLGLMGAAQSVEIWHFILSFIALGIGNGIGITPLIGVVNHWFLKKRGNSTGIASSGGSVGGLVFPLMLRHLYSAYGYVWAIRILAFTCLGFMICSIFLVKERFRKEKQTDLEVSSLGKGLSWSLLVSKIKSMKSPDLKFVHLVIGTLFTELSLVLLLTYFASYAIANGVSESTAYLLLTVWNTAGILGRWIPGFTSDIFGRFNVFVVMLISYCLCIFILLYPFGSNSKVMYAFAGLGGYCSGCILGLPPACLSQITPVNEFGARFGFLCFILSFANLFGIPIAASIIKSGTPKEYNNFVIFVGCLGILGTMFWTFSRAAIHSFMSTLETIELTNRPTRQHINVDPEQDSTTIESITPIATVNNLYGEDDPNDYPDGGIKAYSVILGSFMGLVVNLGLINSIGAIQAYVSTHQLSGLKETSISWIFSIYLSLAYAGGLVVGPLFDRKGPLEILIVSTAFIFLGLMGAAQSVEIWQFILSFISLGIGNGLGMTPLIGVISHWFSKKRGNCTGLATSGGSVGGLIFPLMLRHSYVVYGYVWAIRILAFTCLGFMICSICLVKERFRVDKTSQDEEEQSSSVKKISFEVLISKIKGMNAKDFKYIYVILGAFFAELSLVLLVTYFASYAIANGVSESTAYLLLTVWNATGILGRWIPGFISDIYGRFNVNIVMLFSYCLCILVLLYPFGASLKVLYAFAGVGGYCSGSILGLLPACLSQITPVNEIGTKYGILNFILSLANLFGIPIAAAIIKNGTPKEYDNFVVLVGCLAVAGTLFWSCSRVAIVGFKLNVKV
ncbi:MCH5 Riboflavin transporter MCH5 [Candida maltosa Xu316]